MKFVPTRVSVVLAATALAVSGCGLFGDASQAADGLGRSAVTETELTPTTNPSGPGSSSTVLTEPIESDELAWLHELNTPGRTFLGVSTANDTLEEIADFALAARRWPDAVLISRDWSSGFFDLETAKRLTSAGTLPVFAWEPWDHTQRLNGDRLRAVQPQFSLRTIIDGEHDALISQWAQGAADWGHPIALRFAHEMNGYWYPWSELANGNSDGEFVLAWRHVHNLFSEAGAGNVIWVWSPNLTGPTLTDLESVYPGDAYVDWIGLVGYLGNGIDPREWTPTFDELFGPTLDEVRRFTELPAVITEIGATELGGQKAAWTTGILTTVAARDDVIGLMWFEVDKESDWRIVSSTAATAAFAAGVADDLAWGIPRDGQPTSELLR